MSYCWIERVIDRFVNLKQDEKSITAELFAPGVKPGNLEIWVEGNQLRVRLNGTEEQTAWDRLYLTRELRLELPGDSWRRVQPDSEQTAVLHDGVLVVTLQKSQKKVIPVHWIASSES